MQIGIDSFVETTPDPLTGITITAAERVRDLLEEVELADQVGLDVFGIGEHHRKEFLDSAPAVILAAAAARTKQIRLDSAVTVLCRTTRSVSFRTLPRSTSSRTGVRKS